MNNPTFSIYVNETSLSLHKKLPYNLIKYHDQLNRYTDLYKHIVGLKYPIQTGI